MSKKACSFVYPEKSDTDGNVLDCFLTKGPWVCSITIASPVHALDKAKCSKALI